MTLALMLLAVAVLLVPVGPVVPARSPTAGGVPRAGGPSRAAPTVAVVALGAAAVALLGVPRGVLVAAVLCPAALVLLRRLARAPTSALTPADRAALPLVLDLAAAALRAGRPTSAALAAAAPVAPDGLRNALVRVAGLLRLGADPAGAWQVVDDAALTPVRVVAVRSASSGARLAASFERLAAELRAEATSIAASRAQRAGVRAMAPLGACFLPSFVLLGIVPVVVGMAASALSGVG